MSDSLQAILAQVAQLRAVERDLVDQVATLQSELDATPLYQQLAALREQHQAAKMAVSEAEAQARSAALAEYAASGERKPAPGIEIRLWQVVDFDEQAATDWCRVHAPNYLTVDAKRFREAASTLVGAPLVVRAEPRASLRNAEIAAYLAP